MPDWLNCISKTLVVDRSNNSVLSLSRHQRDHLSLLVHLSLRQLLRILQTFLVHRIHIILCFWQTFSFLTPVQRDAPKPSAAPSDEHSPLPLTMSSAPAAAEVLLLRKSDRITLLRIFLLLRIPLPYKRLWPLSSHSAYGCWH